ncbi:MAG: gamma carbonic anhydrase family protein [Pseudomonadota bacterium]
MIHRLGDRQPILEGTGHYIAHGAHVIGSVRLGDKVSVWFNAVIRGDNDWIVVGARSNIQDGAVLHTDPGLELRVGEGVTVGHRAVLHGCRIGGGALIGIGSTVLNGAQIGANTVVGANSLVTEDKAFPEGVLLVGQPAKIVRELTQEEIALLERPASGYVEKGELYRAALEALT